MEMEGLGYEIRFFYKNLSEIQCYNSLLIPYPSTRCITSIFVIADLTTYI